jgi:hypothetical protein
MMSEEIPADDILSTLDADLTKDAGHACESWVIDRLAVTYTEDKAQWARIMVVLKKHGQAASVTALVRTAAKKRKGLRVVADGERQMVPIKSILPDAPVSDDAVVPSGWMLQDEQDDNTALVRFVEAGDQIKRVPICSRPCLVTAWITNETTHEKAAEVAWKAADKWHSQIVSLKRLADGSKILDALAGRGMPIHANNRLDLIQWFADYLTANVKHMPTRMVSEQMGWHDASSFICGRQCIAGPDGNDLRFVGPDDGDNQLADAVRSQGTFEGWQEAIRPLHQYPRVQLALYASLATPLLKVLNVPNFVLDYAYQTSSGKTSALKVAASVWGNPDERCGSSMIAAWDARPTWIERAAATRNHLPLILDDSKRAIRGHDGKSQLATLVYAISNGEGRGRGTITGTQITKHWRTILISSGEHRLVDESKDAGTAARILSVWANPWGGVSTKTAEDIQGVIAGVSENFGIAGPMFVQYIIANREDDLAEWKESLAYYTKSYTTRLTKSNGAAVGSRVAVYLALLQLTAELAHEALWLNAGLDENCVGQCFDDLADGPKDTDRALEALQMVCSWAVANRARFAASEVTEMPVGGFFGRWDHASESGGKTVEWKWLGVFRHELEAVLKKAGHEPESITRLWASRGWLDADEGKLTCKSTRIAGHNAKVIAINRTAFDLVSGEWGNDNERQQKLV